MRVGSWEEAERLAVQEAERRLGARIERYWVDSIALEPSTHGGKWSIKLDLRIREGRKRRLLRVAIRIDPETGEPAEFRVEG